METNLSNQKYGGSYCCVVGCNNCQARDNHRGVKFFGFPKKEQQLILWTSCVKRVNPDGSSWKPRLKRYLLTFIS